MRLALSVALFVLLLAVWEGVIRFFGVSSYLVPPPSAVVAALARGLSSGIYLNHLLVTLVEIALGFLLGAGLGFCLGVAISLSATIDFFFRPYILVFQTIPKVALAPLIVLWFGLGITSKVVSAAVICFFPVMVNTVTGLRAADPDRVSLLRAMGASPAQIFRALRLPTAAPYIFAGLEIAVTFALIGTIVAEFLGAEKGLGMLMQSMNYTLDVSGSFSVLVLLSLIGVALTGAIHVVRRWVLYWEK
ncbi:ABC transporter permease [Undibacter mobilis]|nr:ABC transporter permease [Undibacter mobilis]